jgi:hypothetical protein
MPDGFPKWLCHFTLPLVIYEGYNFSPSLSTFVMTWLLFYLSYPSGYKFCVFDLHFSNDNDVEHIFICLLAICFLTSGYVLTESCTNSLIK